jgi:hypothetical protein
MAREKNGTTKQADKKPSKQTEQTGKATDEKQCDVFTECVSPGGIILMAIYLIVLSILLVYAILQFWPPQLPPEQVEKNVEFLYWKIPISVELRLLVVVVLTGALGGQIHTLRSFVWYVGNRKLITSWLMQYLLTPFEGASLALVFYFIICASFFPANTTTQNMNIYGFAGLAGLVGLFSNMAVKKLRDMAEQLLGAPETGKDSLESKQTAKEILGPPEEQEDSARKDSNSGKK